MNINLECNIKADSNRSFSAREDRMIASKNEISNLDELEAWLKAFNKDVKKEFKRLKEIK